jgi:hypothetical protein
MICSFLVKRCILRSLMYFLIMFYDELIQFQKKKKVGLRVQWDTKSTVLKV